MSLRRKGVVFRHAAFAFLPALLAGCYASVGPTIGYRTGRGMTYGGEFSGAALVFAHASAGAYVTDAKYAPVAGSKEATVYSSIGPGIFAPLDGPVGGSVAAGIGLAHEAEGDFILGRLWGGPRVAFAASKDDRSRAQTFYTVNCFLSVAFWNDGAWLSLSPQLGVSHFPAGPD